MACNIAPTGPCSIASDDDPISPKAYNASLVFTKTGAYGYSDYFTIEWNNSPSSTDTLVMFYRLETASGMEDPRVVVDFDDGVINSETGKTLYEIFKYWIRRESTTEYGPWQVGYAVIDPTWDEDIDEVKHLGVIVIHDSVVVTHT